MSAPDQSPLAGKDWLVHKFGGTSVASAECFLRVVQIIEDSLDNTKNVAIVVSAMGGKPKTTDLLLSTVSAAASRDDAAVQAAIQKILDKHTSCLETLFGSELPAELERLLSVVKKDIDDILDILKTVSLMKWQAARISELVSGYGEVWSTQILAALLQMRASAKTKNQQALPTNGNNHQDAYLLPSTIPNKSESLSMDAEDSDESPANDQNDHNGIDATNEFYYVDARRVIIVDEDAVQTGAVCWDISQTKLQDVYREACAKAQNPKSKVHLVMTGYVASNTNGVATTLQRDGSDYSAAILGRLLGAAQINIWTDVDGCLSADPRRVPGAYVIPDVSYNEAMELSYFGAKVIHPKTMQPAISSNPQIPIFIRNTFNPTFRGTRIFTVSTTASGDGDKCVCGFSSIENIALINVEGTGMMGVPGVANRLFGTLEKMQVNVILISQASSEHSITFATRQDHVGTAKAALEEEFRREIHANHITEIQVKEPCSIIAAVGDGMSNVAGVSGRFFSALGQAKINVLAISQGCSERNISAVVKTEESTRALRAIHAAFRLSHTTVRVGIVGLENNEIGTSLLKLLQAQRDKLRSIFDVDLQVVAVVPNSTADRIVRLTVDKPGTNDSITNMAYNDAMSGDASNMEDSAVSFKGQTHEIATVEAGGLESLYGVLFQEECTHHVCFDCTSNPQVGKMHAAWLRSGINIVTANNTGLSGPKEQLDEIRAAEKLYGKLSAHYLREVTVGGALPVITTLHSLLDSGDRIRRMDGIMSVSMSFIMYRISPPPRGSACYKFDEEFTMGAFGADTHSNEPCLFSEAIKEAVSLGLMEKDPSLDLNNDYTARNLMVLAQELGVEQNVSAASIQESSEKLLEVCMPDGAKIDYQDISSGAMDEAIKKRVDAARERGCVLRHISSVNVRDRGISIRIVEVPDTHVFALTPPSCETVRFFTHRHETYPLVIQGPSAGADSTASALLAELLHLMKEKVGPRRVTLSRRGSATLLSNESLKGLEE
ncbi:aspartokinase/homoserine dehydrogenase, chloroplastic [Seminavis robusta]|uniref:Aspartokinase/homoserine dehydrogenase, chloroplastic n=1 Tax=Seminavis robusta TaxID=568900 RepID=A0A9N8D748_9STRA|nr:aspartokinase/homoserine dehydrogenase, chloroplastic [Seminavis robusta]|eukprot:Sro22_g015170.1 aspartokinase/homoserine dehydrogenase, chloroplastic (1006) ;mRNA; f:28259-31469